MHGRARLAPCAVARLIFCIINRFYANLTLSIDGPFPPKVVFLPPSISLTSSFFSENEPHNLPFRKIVSLLVPRTALKVKDFDFRVVGKDVWALLGLFVGKSTVKKDNNCKVPHIPFDSGRVLPSRAPQDKRSHCERLFSISSYALDDRRRGIIPANFEKQIFLHANSACLGNR